MDTIRIDRLELDCIVGIRPEERDREQRVRVDLAFSVDVRSAGRSGRISETCDYDAIAEEVVSMLRFRRYRLIEMATEELAAMLLGSHPIAERVSIRLEKPGALEGRARAASVEITRTRADFVASELEQGYGTVHTLLDTPEAELSLLTLRAGARYTPELGQHRDLHFLVSGQAASGSHALRLFQPRASGRESYDASLARGCKLFRCRSRLLDQL